MDAVAKADEVYEQQKSRPERSQQPATASQFTNFKQRNNNYQDLQQQLLQKSMSATDANICIDLMPTEERGLYQSGQANG